MCEILLYDIVYLAQSTPVVEAADLDWELWWHDNNLLVESMHRALKKHI